MLSAMYKSSIGIRVLQGAERRLFIESLAMIVDLLTDDDFPTEIAIFDDLTRNQRIAVYHNVARALLAEDEPPPRLTAVIEAAVASVYRFAGDMLDLELSDVAAGLEGGELGRSDWRANRAGRGAGGRGKRLPDPDETDPDAWERVLDRLQDRVLWDNDWEMVAALDAAPDRARRVKRELGIAEDYFVAVPPDPRDAEALRLLDELRTAHRGGAITTPPPPRDFDGRRLAPGESR